MFTVTFLEIVGIVISAIASIVIGALWYSPLMFGNVWMREVGLTESKMKNMTFSPTQAIAIAIGIGIVYSILLNILFTWIGVRTIGQGVLLGGVCSIIFFALPLLVHSVFEDSSKKAWGIYVLHELVLSVVVGGIVAWSILA